MNVGRQEKTGEGLAPRSGVIFLPCLPGRPVCVLAQAGENIMAILSILSEKTLRLCALCERD